jgi:hypothetical protein
MATDFSGLEGEALVNAWFGYFDSIAEPADDKVHQWESRIRYRRYKIGSFSTLVPDPRDLPAATRNDVAAYYTEQFRKWKH